MSTKNLEILDGAADILLFVAGANDARNGIAPENPESSISAYFRGRESHKCPNHWEEFAKRLCGGPQ